MRFDENLQLRGVLARARTMGLQADQQVGRRELLLALLADDPRGVVRGWRRCGLDGARLVEAVKEWWPDTQAVAPPVSLPLTEDATAVLDAAGRVADAAACKQLLLERLLDTHLRTGAVAAGSPSETTNLGDPTGRALSSLGLL